MARVNANLADSGNAMQPADFLRLLRTRIYWWTAPAIVGALIAGAYAIVTPREWNAAQALVVRPEVASVSEERLGKFSDLSEMKTLQETVLELAKSQGVIQAALRDVGAPRGYRKIADWPTDVDVDAFRSCVDMRPPGGAEFGKTEVFYLSVSDSNRDRARKLVVALCDQLERRMQELREQSAESMIAELRRTVEMADNDLSAQTSQLSAFEAHIGADLAELRSLNAEDGGQGAVSQELQGIEAERRKNESCRNEHERLLKLLVSAQHDPQQLLATPNSLLVSQPSVSQLKNALVNAQLRTSELLGSRGDEHPFVIASREAEKLVRNQLNSEVAVAIRGLQMEIELCADREESLESKKTNARGRISRLAESRAEYTTIVASVQNHTRLVEAARKNLADARARQAGAHSASVISRIDGADAGVRPAGPGRTTVAMAGGVGGLFVGLGFILLFANPHADRVDSLAVNGIPVECGIAPSTSTQTPSVDSKPSKAPVKVVGINRLAEHLSVRRRTAGEAFGMFSGLSLQEAVRAVQQRCR